MSDAKPEQPPLEGIYAYVPGMPDELTVRTFEILSALNATAEVLSETIDDTHDFRRKEGLANAVRVLTKVLQQCYAGDEVVRKHKGRTRLAGPPKPRKARRTQTGNVVSLVRSPTA